MELTDNISKFKFNGKWREYQKRVLNELSIHLNDNKLNLVAPPGAGKTILGIEVITRLKNPAFILAPTLTIRNQWKQRIIANFLSQESDPDFISTDIRNISEITISTYQSLHSVYKSPDEKEKLINAIKSKNIKTLVLDEAHHLKTEWWSTLNDLSENFVDDDFKIVSLTGTPPYDTSISEWRNYSTLCGPVDAEISVPELVKAGDLCPHQDLVYFSNLNNEEEKIYIDFEKNRADFLKYVYESPDIFYAIESSSFLCDIENNVEIIYKNTDFTISLVSYLLDVDSLNINARILLEFLGLTIDKIPKFDFKQAEVLFEGIIGEFSSEFKNTLLIKNELRKHNLLNGKNVDFTGNIDFKKLFARSKNKLDAINKITEFEYNKLNDKLREVILLDYIGKGDSEKLNISTVFENLKTLNINCAILTGTLIVIPKTSKEKLYEILDLKNIDKKQVLTNEYNDKYLRIEIYGKIDIVSIVTELFKQGCFNILIGTASLLGEGWDSPCVNTLIIASVVGSFVLSNQMRGRALRIDKNNSYKTSNIWHLVSLCKNETSSDFATIIRRFNTFEGISYNENKIQNGFERLGIDFENEQFDCDILNKKMFEYATKRDELTKNWKQIFSNSKITSENMVPQMYDIVSTENIQKTIVCKRLPEWCFGLDFLIKKCSISRYKSKNNIIEKLFLKACHHFDLISDDYTDIINNNSFAFKHEQNMRYLSKSLLQSMCDLSIIKTNYKKINLIFNSKENSKFYFTITGCTNYERNLFINAFGEIFAINDKNRYILKYNNQYIAVPECLAKHNKNVKTFVSYLEESFGYFDIIYTRNPEGYKELLKAKFNIMNLGFLKQSRVWM